MGPWGTTPKATVDMYRDMAPAFRLMQQLWCWGSTRHPANESLKRSDAYEYNMQHMMAHAAAELDLPDSDSGLPQPVHMALRGVMALQAYLDRHGEV
jgi:hypothetical protein